jgi:signal transduction histidine kinase
VEPLQAYLGSQPRRVRIFNDQLELVWCNRPHREGEDLEFADGAGQHSRPPAGIERDYWPVKRVFEGVRAPERLYPLGGFAEEDPRAMPRWRVVAWPLSTSMGLLAVEETEWIAAPQTGEVGVKVLDQDIEVLLQRVLVSLDQGAESGPLRLDNPFLGHCRDKVACSNRHCPAYDNPTAARCWEMTAAADGEASPGPGVVARFVACSHCEVFEAASPTSLARISENFNRLISLLQLKYQETLDVQHRMQQADKLAVMGELLAGIAHEIKNPLGIIIGRLDVIALEVDNLDPAVLTEDLATIHQQANRVRQIIDHMLAMARPAPPRFGPVRANSVVVDSLEMVRKTLAEKQLRVTTSLQPDLPAIHADQIQVQQVLLNLVLNARDALQAGGHLHISTRLLEGDEPGVEVLVADDGEGIPPDVLRRLFTSFQTTKLSKGGTGLGLAVCRRIMELHNGRVSAESAPGEGTTMRLWFPLGESLA